MTYSDAELRHISKCDAARAANNLPPLDVGQAKRFIQSVRRFKRLTVTKEDT